MEFLIGKLLCCRLVFEYWHFTYAPPPPPRGEAGPSPPLPPRQQITFIDLFAFSLPKGTEKGKAKKKKALSVISFFTSVHRLLSCCFLRIAALAITPPFPSSLLALRFRFSRCVYVYFYFISPSLKRLRPYDFSSTMEQATLFLAIAGAAPNLRPPPLALSATAPLARLATEMTPKGFVLHCGVEVGWKWEPRMTYGLRRTRRIAFTQGQAQLEVLQAMRWWLQRAALTPLEEVCTDALQAFENPEIPGQVSTLRLHSSHMLCHARLNNYPSLRTLHLGLGLRSLEFDSFDFSQLETVNIECTSPYVAFHWLSRCTSLHTLQLKYCRGYFSAVGTLSTLASLSMQEVHLEDGAGWLGGCVNLRKLDVVSCDAQDTESWAGIGALRELESLELSQCNVTSLDFVASLEWLESATFERCPALSSFEPIGKLKNLKRLSFTSDTGQRSNVEWITGCVALEELALSSARSPISLEPLTTLPKLRSVRITHDHTLQSIAWVNRCRSLETLFLFGCFNIADAESVQHHPSLRQLFYVFSSMTTLSNWVTCSHLEEIELDSSCRFTDAAPLTCLQALPSLRKLRFYPRFAPESTEARRQTGLRGFVQSFRARFSATSHTAEAPCATRPSLAWITACQSLEELTFGEYYDACDWDSLGSLKQLRSVRIRASTVDSVVWVVNCPLLEELHLILCKEIQDWSPLASAQQLKTLDVACSSLRSLACLGVHTNLTTLNIIGCKVTDDESLRNFPSVRKLSRSVAATDKLTWLAPLWNLEELQLEGCSRFDAHQTRVLRAISHRLTIHPPLPPPEWER